MTEEKVFFNKNLLHESASHKRGVNLCIKECTHLDNILTPATKKFTEKLNITQFKNFTPRMHYELRDNIFFSKINSLEEVALKTIYGETYFLYGDSAIAQIPSRRRYI